MNRPGTSRERAQIEVLPGRDTPVCDSGAWVAIYLPSPSSATTGAFQHAVSLAGQGFSRPGLTAKHFAESQDGELIAWA